MNKQLCVIMGSLRPRVTSSSGVFKIKLRDLFCLELSALFYLHCGHVVLDGLYTVPALLEFVSSTCKYLYSYLLAFLIL